MPAERALGIPVGRMTTIWVARKPTIPVATPAQRPGTNVHGAHDEPRQEAGASRSRRYPSARQRFATNRVNRYQQKLGVSRRTIPCARRRELPFGLAGGTNRHSLAVSANLQANHNHNWSHNPPNCHIDGCMRCGFELLDSRLQPAVARQIFRRSRALLCGLLIVDALFGGLTSCSRRVDERDSPSGQAEQAVVLAPFHGGKAQTAKSDKVCTLRECSDYLAIQFEPPITEQGRYSILLVGDDKSVVCPMRILLTSIGTGEQWRPIHYRKAKNWGLIRWARPILDVVFDGVSDTVDFQARQLLENDYHRPQARLDENAHNMDDASEPTINALRLYAEELIAESERTPERTRGNAQAVDPTHAPLMRGCASA